MPRNHAGDTDSDCAGCGIEPSRRDFVRVLGAGIAGALATIGLTHQAAAELPVSAMTALTRTRRSHTYPLPVADGVQIDRGAEVILVRWQSAVYAFNLSCPHQNTALRWNEKDHRFKCPKHNSRYEPDGTFVDGRATRGMDRFSVAVQGATVIVNVDAMHKQDVDPTGWAAAIARVPA